MSCLPLSHPSSAAAAAAELRLVTNGCQRRHELENLGKRGQLFDRQLQIFDRKK